MRDAVPTNDEFSAPQHTHNTQHLQLFRGAPQAQRMSLAAAVKNDAMAIRKRLLAKKCSCSALRLMVYWPLVTFSQSHI